MAHRQAIFSNLHLSALLELGIQQNPRAQCLTAGLPSGPSALLGTAAPLTSKRETEAQRDTWCAGQVTTIKSPSKFQISPLSALYLISHCPHEQQMPLTWKYTAGNTEFAAHFPVPLHSLQNITQTLM